MPSKSQPVKQVQRIMKGRPTQYELEPPSESESGSDSEFDHRSIPEQFASDLEYIPETVPETVPEPPQSHEDEENIDPQQVVENDLPSQKRRRSQKESSQTRKRKRRSEHSEPIDVDTEPPRTQRKTRSLPSDGLSQPRASKASQRAQPTSHSEGGVLQARDSQASQRSHQASQRSHISRPSQPSRHSGLERPPSLPLSSQVASVTQSSHDLFVESSPPSVIDNTTLRPMHIDEEEINRQLDLMARRFYIVHLSKEDTSLVVKHVMPWIAMSEPLYNKARRKLQILFKTWKNRVLSDAGEWFQEWTQQSQSSHLSNELDFKVIKETLNRRFQLHWLPKVFAFAREAVDFESCSRDGKLWMKYAFIQLVIRAHLYNRRKFNVADPKLAKHDRRHLLAAYDGLGKKKEFRNLTEEDFPLLAAKPHRTAMTYCLDLDEESDGSVGGDFEDEVVVNRSDARV